MTHENETGPGEAVPSKLEATPAGGGDRPAISPGRRRFVTGVATGSILMTVANRPALAGVCTPSAWVSGNLSPRTDQESCGGRSPGFWKANVQRWPSLYDPGTCKNKGPGTCNKFNDDGTPFHQGVGDGSGPFFGSTFGALTLMQVLWLKGHEDPHQLGAHIVAALLNAVTIPEYGMTEADVVEIWFQLETKGFYEVSGIVMDAEEVVRFIQNTFD